MHMDISFFAVLYLLYVPSSDAACIPRAPNTTHQARAEATTLREQKAAQTAASALLAVHPAVRLLKQVHQDQIARST